MTLPLPPPHNWEPHCDICGTAEDLVVTLQRLDEQSTPLEWRCHDCIKAVNIAREQRNGTNKFYSSKR